QQDYAPMPAGRLPERLRVGVFLCKDVDEERLREVVEQVLGDSRVERVVVRPHPRNLWLGLDAWIAERGDPRLVRSSGRGVADDLEAVDVVLAGNSSVLVEAVTAGRPSAYVRGLDYGPADMHAFVERGLVCSFGDGVDFGLVLDFYRRPDWPAALRLFANV